MNIEQLKELLGADITSEKLEALEKAINTSKQSETDRVRTQYSKEKKELQDKIEQIKMSNMTEIEKREAIIKKNEEMLAEKEKDTAFKLKTLYLKEKGYDLGLIDYINGENEEGWENSYSKINSTINGIVENKLKSQSGREDLGGNKEPKEKSEQEKGLDQFDKAFND